MVPMDDFKIIISMELLWKVNMVPMSYFRTMGILNKKVPNTILTQMVNKDKGKVLMLSINSRRI